MRALLADEAQTEMGRELAATVEPLTDPSEVRTELQLTRQARLARATSGSLPLDGFPDIRPALDHCRTIGSVLDGADLVRLVPALLAIPRLEAYGTSVEAVAPEVTAIIASLPRFHELADRLGRSLDADGAVTDDASPRIRHLRREIRERRRRVTAELERAFQNPDAERIFADRYVTIRHGRYVLPVRAEARGRVRGIVHDRSQSAQTLFVEPETVVEANNDLVQTMREEEQETARILAELTDAVRERIDDLERMVASVGRLDWIFTRGEAADRMEAIEPEIDRGRTLSLKSARHPLLLAQGWKDPERPVVPVDIELSAERPLLLITGPNAGGKTIALKTAALLTLMAQTGCHIPAAEGSRLPIVTDLFAIVGDDQSVAENLSTFSAFVKQIREVLDRAGERSLVLLDELGAGTDPDEGAALAQAILEELAERGALVIATTHLEPLKVFASTHPRARNASVEFDTTTLAPTFRLRYDQPGQSYALTIAARLGLAPELIARAQAHRSEHAARLSDLLTALDAHARTEAERAREIERARTDAAVQLAKARETAKTAEGKAKTIVERAKAEAMALLTRHTLEEGRQRLREVAARVEAVAPAAAPAHGDRPRALEPGQTVAAEHLGIRGKLLTISGSTATVRSGSLTIRVPLQALRPVGGDGESEPGAGVPSVRVGSRAKEPAPPPREIAPELLLLGRTTDEARDIVEKYLDDAFLAGLPSVRLIHGKGSGALRKAVRDLLTAHPLVDSFRDGEPAEGGPGATVAALRVS